MLIPIVFLFGVNIFSISICISKFVELFLGDHVITGPSKPLWADITDSWRHHCRLHQDNKRQDSTAYYYCFFSLSLVC